MRFNGTEGEAIELAKAAAWTANYRKAGAADTAKSHFFGTQIIQSLLEQEGCVGIRMYYALDDDRKKQLILIGVDESGNDLESGLVADRSVVCPPDCGTDGTLSR
ncbi:hypothetical protein ACFS7Z_15135 [Pontibacter toksunensis]|uniref:Uncharacterized protein n=1 Tax=Pontibacter toksunensis TaxID=1332631 RepID=A0ABW6BWJ5_9BACT